MTIQQSVSDNALIPPEAVQMQFSRALALWMGLGRRYSVADVHVATGLPETTLRSYLGGARMPSLSSALALAAFFGPEFTNRWINLAGQGAFLLPDTGAKAPMEVAADLASDAAAVTRHAADGRFDHIESAVQMNSIGPRLVALGGSMMSGAVAA